MTNVLTRSNSKPPTFFFLLPQHHTTSLNPTNLLPYNTSTSVDLFLRPVLAPELGTPVFYFSCGEVLGRGDGVADCQGVLERVGVDPDAAVLPQ